MALARVVVLAAFSIGACVWALVRVYTHPKQPMWVMAPVAVSTTTTTSADAGEIPAPELQSSP